MMINEGYVEMDKALATILNTDWLRKSWLRYVAARIIEGTTLLTS